MSEYICPHCGKPIADDDALLCLYCGKSLGRDAGFLSKLKYGAPRIIVVIAVIAVLLSFVLLMCC